ncbi:hypothetical protein DMO52_26710 [Salmonella enterica subsp. enterica serovar Amager]|nr:hypothetical protein [Salmonella enterica subsp. enterica serovar Amager]EBV5220863.1 hypothetical protein [Salmonella enterica subsp. enterica serovar Amager]EBW4031938.1 hypothetical protein [Salmonella enterica subsp. enterica serovar Newport]
MAVENKFRLNVIAASVLMGLSLSAMAERGASSATTTPAETAPAKPATLASLAVPLKDDAVTVTVKGVEGQGINDGTGMLKAILEASTGSVGATNQALTAAQGNYAQLTSDQKKLITDLNDAVSVKNQATQAWNEFGNKLSAANSVYTDSLNSMYGENKNAFTVSNEGKVVADASSSDGSTYGLLLNANNDFNQKVSALYTGVATALNSNNHEEQTQTNQLNEVKVIAYTNYLQQYAAFKTAELQVDSIRNIVVQNIASVLQVVDANPASSDSLGAFKAAFNTWKDDKSDANEKALASSFSTLVSEGSLSLQDPISGVTWANVASAWSTAVQDKIDAATHLSNATDPKKTESDTGSLAAALSSFKKTYASALGNVSLGESDYPSDLQGAMSGLKAAYTALLTDSAFKKDSETLNQLILHAHDAGDVLDGLKGDYLAQVSDVNQAGTARLNLLLNELPVQQQKLLTAWTNYQTKKGNLSNDSTATGAWKELYGEDGNGGALGAYLDSLKNTSDGLDDAFATAKSTYQSVAGNKQSTQAQKNAALYKLIGTQKVLTQEKLKLDTAYLNVLKTGVSADISSLVGDRFKGLDTLKADLNTAATNKAEAKAQYVDAVKAYRDADSAYQASKSEADAATLATAKAKLMTVVGITSPSDFSKLYVNNTDMTQGFKSFDNLSALTADNSDVIGKYNAALAALDTTSDGGTEIQKVRKAVVDDMNRLAGLMPLSSCSPRQRG